MKPLNLSWSSGYTDPVPPPLHLSRESNTFSLNLVSSRSLANAKFLALSLSTWTCTYTYLLIELFSRRDRVAGPGNIQVGGQVVGAVGSVPLVGAGGPGQCGTKGGQEVVECPGHYGIVVEGDVECNDADGIAYTYKRTWLCKCF